MEEPVELCRSERLASLGVGLALGAWGLMAFRVISIPAVVVAGGLVARGLRGTAHFPVWSRRGAEPPMRAATPEPIEPEGEPEPASRREAPSRPDAEWHELPDVDETSLESFPASDPPSWSPVVGAGRR